MRAHLAVAPGWGRGVRTARGTRQSRRGSPLRRWSLPYSFPARGRHSTPPLRGVTRGTSSSRPPRDTRATREPRKPPALRASCAVLRRESARCRSCGARAAREHDISPAGEASCLSFVTLFREQSVFACASVRRVISHPVPIVVIWRRALPVRYPPQAHQTSPHTRPRSARPSVGPRRARI